MHVFQAGQMGQQQQLMGQPMYPTGQENSLVPLARASLSDVATYLIKDPSAYPSGMVMLEANQQSANGLLPQFAAMQGLVRSMSVPVPSKPNNLNFGAGVMSGPRDTFQFPQLQTYSQNTPNPFQPVGMRMEQAAQWAPTLGSYDVNKPGGVACANLMTQMSDFPVRASTCNRLSSADARMSSLMGMLQAVDLQEQVAQVW